MDQLIIARAPGHIVLGCDQDGACESGRKLAPPLLTVAVGYYAYAIVSSSRSDRLQIFFAGHRRPHLWSPEDEAAWGEGLTLPTAVAELLGIQAGLTVSLSVHAPHDVALGLASSLTISLIKALAYSCGLDLGPTSVADLASRLRTKHLGLPDDSVGLYAAALGGFNHINISERRLKITPLEVSPATRESLEKQLMLFTVGPTLGSTVNDSPPEGVRPQPDLAPYDQAKTPEMVNRHMRFALEDNDLPAFAELLHEVWQYQTRVGAVDEDSLLALSYRTAREYGAMGGQIVKNGQRDALLLFCPRPQQPDVRNALTKFGLRHWPVTLEDNGSQLMEVTPRERPLSSSLLAGVSPVSAPLRSVR